MLCNGRRPQADWSYTNKTLEIKTKDLQTFLVSIFCRSLNFVPEDADIKTLTTATIADHRRESWRVENDSYFVTIQ